MVAVTRSALLRQIESSNRTKKVTSKVVKKKLIKKKKPAAKRRTNLSKVSKKKTTAKQRKTPPKVPKKKTTPEPCTTSSKTGPRLEPYNEVVGRSNITDAYAYDYHGNPTGREYDLGRDGAFVGFNILIAQFYSDIQFNDAAMQIPIKELNSKGFQVKHVKTENECIKELDSGRYQVAWIISTSHIQNPEFVTTLTKFHSNGGGIFLFSDNTPYIYHASEFLQKKFGITLDGGYYGGKVMTFKEDGHQQTGHFGQHEIFTGIKNLFEGITICHPVYSTEASRKVFVTIATATDGNSSIGVYDPPTESSDGRLCLDCGFTKLYINWDSAGTARYIVNASCWLLRIEKHLQ